MIEILPIARVDGSIVEELLDAAFGPDRHKRTAYLLRRGMPVIDHLSFAIIDGSDVIGSIHCWPIAVGPSPLILVGPVAVAPDRQLRGTGRQLMEKMLDAVRPDDPPMTMIGDPEYYGRFGFSADDTGGGSSPGRGNQGGCCCEIL